MRFKRRIYITKTLQKKNFNSPGRAWSDEKNKGGGVKPNFTPSSPIFFQTHQRLPKTYENHHFCTNFKLLLCICLNYSCFPFIPLKQMAPKKLLTKKARKTTAGEGSIVAPQAEIEFDGHHFWSEEHQRCFEAIKGLSFLKERRVQLREGEYTEFQAEVAKWQWT